MREKCKFSNFREDEDNESQGNQLVRLNVVANHLVFAFEEVSRLDQATNHLEGRNQAIATTFNLGSLFC